MPSPKEQFLDVYRKEHATTVKVMKAYPADKAEFQPHPRSASAKRLMHTFGMEQGVVAAAINGTPTMPPNMPPEPVSIALAIAAFEKGCQSVEQALGKVPDSRLHETVDFYTGPKQMGKVPILDIMWLMLMDQVHHRGQLSVYLRMAGGKVPSIYGPSADEPWM